MFKNICEVKHHTVISFMDCGPKFTKKMALQVSAAVFQSSSILHLIR